MGLCVCSACNRHVKECTAVCPFCGAAFVAAKVKCAEPSARAAAAAIGAAVVLSGCTSTMSEPLYGGSCGSTGCYEPPGPDATMDSGADTTMEAAAEAGAPDVGGEPDEGTPDTGTPVEGGDDGEMSGDAGEGG